MNNERYIISGYRDGDGNVSDLVVEQLPATGYRDLVVASLKVLEDVDEFLKPFVLAGYEASALLDALNRMRGTMLRYLDPTVEKKEWAAPRRDAGVTYLDNLKVITRTWQGNPPNLTITEMLRNALPVGSYVRALKLAEGKFVTFSKL